MARIMDRNTPLLPAESPSGSMTKMQVNVEMHDLTGKEDHPRVEIAQPSRKAEETSSLMSDFKGGDEDGVSDSHDDSVGDGKGTGDNNGEGEENLIDIIKRGNIYRITEELTPKAMTKCGRNVLLTAMEVNSKLRNLANKKGPGAEEFAKMANSVDAFTSCLLDPLKFKKEARHVFRDCLDDLLDAGIDMKQKTFFAHPAIFNLTNDKWLGMFSGLEKYPWLSSGGFAWIVVHIWCLLDLVMFPLLFPVFYNKHRRNKDKLEDKGKEIAFLINATSKNAFKLMARSMKAFVDKYGDANTKYPVLIHGDSSSPIKMCSKSDIDNLELKRGTTKIPAVHEDLKNVADFLIRNSKKKSKWQEIIFFTDDKASSKDLVQYQVKPMKDIWIRPVAIGPHVNIQELELTNDYVIIRKTLHFGEYENPNTVSTRIWQALNGEDLYEVYYDYFTIPYFIFFRDTLSYLTLLGLHVALCLSPSVVPFSGLEWVILVFFMGRILMESKQFRDIGGEDEGSFRISKTTTFAKMCGKYLSDRWNILDFTTLVIYLITFLLRIVTWATSASVTNNRALVLAGYLYGLNTMFLTLRAFGHVMETIRGIGTIQIALFQIIGDISTIFWQFLATILAFSLAITKVYMAEKSYIAEESHNDNLACNASGIFCWWTMFKHLCWSLLGIAELDPLESVDNGSLILAKLLYAIFLIMGVVLLVNMMIALLSNTFQRVEDNAYKEWSFKKAITIQTYSSYHPIPVPLNLISNLCVKVKCMACCKEQEDGNDAKARNESLDAVIQNLQQTYFETYGNSFPLTDDEKMDQLIQETDRNREMFNKIAHKIFTTNAPDQGILPTGQKAWQSQGIRIEGSLLVCEGGKFCDTCQCESDECHGARYLVPFNPEFPHLEVLIQEPGENRRLGVGVVWRDYENHAMPGQTKQTVGYLVHEGKILGPPNPANLAGTAENEGAMAYRGDLIGCTVMFQELKDGKVPIQFTLNGKQITEEKILIEYNPAEKSLYPFIGMGQAGVRVLVKLCPSSNDDAHLIGTIKATTDSMTETMASNWERVDTIVKQMKRELSNADKEFKKLNNIVLEKLGHLERLIEDPDQVWRDEAIDELVTGGEFCALWEEPIRMEELASYRIEPGPGLEDQQPQYSLLKRAQENLEELKQTTDTKFDSFLETMTAAIYKANDRMRHQEDKTERVETKLRNVQESLKDLLKARLSH